MLQVVDLIVGRAAISRLGQRHLVLGRLPRRLLNPFVHPIHHRPCEVCLGVGQSLLVVRACSLGEGKQPLPLQVFHVDGLLPGRSVLHKVPGQHLGQPDVLSSQSLTSL